MPERIPPLEASIHVDAPLARVWQIVADQRRMNEFSPETYRQKFFGDEIKRGTISVNLNKRKGFFWPSASRITEFVPEQRLAFYVFGPADTWSYDLAPDGDGTLVTERRELKNGKRSIAVQGHRRRSPSVASTRTTSSSRPAWRPPWRASRRRPSALPDCRRGPAAPPGRSVAPSAVSEQGVSSRVSRTRPSRFGDVNSVNPRMDAGDLGPQDLDGHIYQRLLKERIVFLGSEVKDQNANAICAQMLLLNAEDDKSDIFLYINSPGGSVDSGMAIYDTMQFIPNDVVTVGMGLAASMGQFLLAAGTKGKRYALPHARIMMHQPSGGIGGSASDIKIQAEQSLLLKKQLNELQAHHTGQTLEQIEIDSDRDRWFTPQQAQEYGFIDHVVLSAGDVK